MGKKKKGNRGKGKGNTHLQGKRALIMKEEGQQYAHVLKMLGNGRMQVLCMDEKKRIARIRGKFRKKVWINVGDVVLVEIRPYDEEKCDILHLYYPHEARKLKKLGEIKKELDINQKQKDGDGFVIEFEDDDFQEQEKQKKKKEKTVDIGGMMPPSNSENEEEEEEES